MLARNLVGEPLVLKDLNSMWGQVDILAALCVNQKARRPSVGVGRPHFEANVIEVGKDDIHWCRF